MTRMLFHMPIPPLGIHLLQLINIKMGMAWVWSDKPMCLLQKVGYCTHPYSVAVESQSFNWQTARRYSLD